MLNLKQFRELIVKQTLKDIGLWSQVAENLLVGTALIESRLTYLKQNPGPALGIYQMEPQTYRDLLMTLGKSKNIALSNRILTVCHMQSLPLDASIIVGNLTIATIMARLKYYFNSAPLPSNDIAKIADYYKLIYNTAKGAAKVEDFMNLYNEYSI